MLKIGDKVKIKSRDWFEENKQVGRCEDWCVEFPGEKYYFSEEMCTYCGDIAKITYISESKDEEPTYSLNIDDGCFGWTESMFDFIKSPFSVLLFGDLYILANLKNGKCVPEFFTTLEDAENYCKKVGS